LRLFRQTRPTEWQPVLDRVAAALQEKVAEKNRSPD
jgi:hypothetical protein